MLDLDLDFDLELDLDLVLDLVLNLDWDFAVCLGEIGLAQWICQDGNMVN